MFHHLLIPLDGSAPAEWVLGPAAFLAEKCEARVTLLHVLERHAPANVHGSRHLTTAEEAQSYMEEVAARAFPSDISVNWHVHTREVRDVAHSLVDHADEYEPDLVIMCAHGESRLRDLLSGTIAQQVVSRGVIPVLYLRQNAASTRAFPFRNILVPLDGDAVHEQALPAATDLARACGATLHLITVVPTGGTLSGQLAVTGSLLPGSTRAMLDLKVETAREYLEGLAGDLRAQGVEADARVVRGAPADHIADAAGDLKADLVALGTHGKAGTKAFWAGSLTQRLLRRIHNAAFLLAPVIRATTPKSRPPTGTG